MAEPPGEPQADRTYNDDDQHHQHDDSPHTQSPTMTTPTLDNKGSSNFEKVTLVIFGSCSIFFYAGALFGWGPMQLLLEENGNFQLECIDDWQQQEDVDTGTGTATDPNDLVCPAQTSALLTCRSVSQLTVLTSPLWGWMSDKYGGQSLTYTLFVTMILGLVLLIIAFEFPGTQWDAPLLYTSFISIGIGSTCGGLLTVVTALFFSDPENSLQEQNEDEDRNDPNAETDDNDDDNNDEQENQDKGRQSNKAQSRVISLMSSLFDAAAMTYLTLWGLVQLTSNVRGVMISYLGFAVICLGGYAYYFRRVAKKERAMEDEKRRQQDENGKSTSIQVEGHKKEARDTAYPVNARHATPPLGRLSTVTTLMTEETISRFCGDDQAVDLFCEGSDEEPSNIDQSRALNTPPSSSSQRYVTIAKRPFLSQLRSKAFVLLCIFFTLHFLSNVWTLTTMRDFLKYLGDDDYNNRYLSIFTLLTPVSLVALPFIDVAIHRFGFATALQAVNTLDLLHCLIKVLPGANLNVQIVGFVIFSFFRSFLFSVTLSSLPTFISRAATGRAMSVLYVVSSAATFINIPLINLAVDQNGGDFFIPNLFFLFLSVPGALIAWWMGKALHRDRASMGRRTIRLMGVDSEASH